MSSYGLYQDSWCQKKCILTYIAKRRISSIQLSIFNPNILLGDITISQQNTKETFEISKKNTLIKFECSVDINTSNNLKIISNLNSTNESDSRQLSYLLASIIFD